jgi:ABC-type branched-subunit amino acid transport system substrate-binding protein
MKVGLLYDFPQGDGGAYFSAGVRLGLNSVAALDEPVELVQCQANGLPAGSEAEVTAAFRSLVQDDVVAVIGPSISDNAMIVTPLADDAGVPCVNYTGGAHTRSEWVFHYQVGSLEEEPSVIAAHLASRRLASVAVVYDDSPVGRGYFDFFSATGVAVRDSAVISVLSTDLLSVLEQLRAAAPDALVYFGLGVASRAVALAVEQLGWDVPVVANSSLMFGYARPEWRDGYEGWVYVDTVSDANAARLRLRERSKAHAASPIGCAAHDMGRLLGEAMLRAPSLTRDGLRRGFERVKRLPASSGKNGTSMGFGPWDHGALKGEFLVLRSWTGGRTVERDAP